MKDKVNYLLVQLNKNYSPEKSEDDYEEILKSFTSDSQLIDITIKEWEKILNRIEGDEKYDVQKRNTL